VVWDNAPGAVLTDVWGAPDPSGPWTHLGRVTNSPIGQTLRGELIVPRVAQQFFRVSHPNIPGHYNDFGTWRVNHKMWGIE
jgi:hypothetical protein